MFSGSGQPIARQRKVTISPRVQFASGLNFPSPVPCVIHDEDEGYNDCHIIEVLSEDTSVQMLAYYRRIGVSYIFAGEQDIDIHTALCKLYSIFGIKRLMLEGGSIINGAFLKADAVDELSLVVAPVTADAEDKPLFYGCESHPFTGASAKVMTSGAVWLRYLDKERFT